MRLNSETETPGTKGTEIGRGRLTGRRWARTGALVGGLVSVSANVTHAFTLPHATGLGTTVSVLSGLLWPSLLMVMTEVIIYNTFHGWSRSLKWAGFPPVAIIAAVSSYLHMRGLLVYSGEGGFIATYGPLAIDGAMVVCSGALMLTRPAQSLGTVITETETLIETETETLIETETETVSVSSVPVVRKSPTVHRLPSLDGLPVVPGLTSRRVSQVMEIRAAVPTVEARAELTWDDYGRILKISGRGSLQKIDAAVHLMDSLDASSDASTVGGELECISM